MSDVFISYSRRDIDFVRHLFDQLTARDREPWADWQDKALAAFALAKMETGPELSLLLATESIRTMSEANETVLPLSNMALRQSLIKSRIRLTLTSHGGQVMSAAYSPDGRWIVTASEDKTTKVSSRPANPAQRAKN